MATVVPTPALPTRPGCSIWTRPLGAGFRCGRIDSEDSMLRQRAGSVSRDTLPAWNDPIQRPM
jgi:hypothetical protein